jgi:hypothetical protein
VLFPRPVPRDGTGLFLFAVRVFVVGQRLSGLGNGDKADVSNYLLS